MKNFTAKEITSDLERIDAEIKSGKAKFCNMTEAKKRIDKSVSALKKNQSEEKRSGANINRRRASQAI